MSGVAASATLIGASAFVGGMIGHSMTSRDGSTYMPGSPSFSGRYGATRGTPGYVISPTSRDVVREKTQSASDGGAKALAWGAGITIAGGLLAALGRNHGAAFGAGLLGMVAGGVTAGFGAGRMLAASQVDVSELDLPEHTPDGMPDYQRRYVTTSDGEWVDQPTVQPVYGDGRPHPNAGPMIRMDPLGGFQVVPAYSWLVDPATGAPASSPSAAGGAT